MRAIYNAFLSLTLLLAANSVHGLPQNFSFRGTFAADDDVQLFGFVANGSSIVTLRSYSYAGGTQSDGTLVARGGFDPILAIFSSTGALIGTQDDDIDDGTCNGSADVATGACFDTFFSQLLAAGTYTVAIMQFDNFALGPNLADGFIHTASPTFTADYGCTNGSFCDVTGDNRSNRWAFDILNVEGADDGRDDGGGEVPEPGTLALLALPVLLAGVRMCRPRP